VALCSPCIVIIPNDVAVQYMHAICHALASYLRLISHDQFVEDTFDYGGLNSVMISFI